MYRAKYNSVKCPKKCPLSVRSVRNLEQNDTLSKNARTHKSKSGRSGRIEKREVSGLKALVSLDFESCPDARTDILLPFI